MRRDQFGDHTVLVLDASEHLFDVPTLANDLIGLAWEHEADVVAVPAMALPGTFYELRSGMLGEMAQKFANYRLHLVVLGDISAQLTASKAFSDYVYEANMGRTLWFVPDLDALEARMLGGGERTQ